MALATRLGDKLGRRKKANVTLIDAQRTHIWKPLLHEVAAGTLDSHQDELEYLAQAHWHHFRFRLGYVDGVDRSQKRVSVAPTRNVEGREIIPRRWFDYDVLVMAVGSVCNDFNIPGVSQHCLFLDTTEQAELFQRRLMESIIYAHSRGGPDNAAQLHVAIVGGGATGVELAAQLHNVAGQLAAYGLDRVDPKRDVKITVIEGTERILPALPKRLSEATELELNNLGVQVKSNKKVVKVDAGGIQAADGEYIPCGIKVWAAGIKAPAFLSKIEGLEVNRLNQIVVDGSLRSTRDASIFALGDCAACPWSGHEGPVPPRAQAAHQQAKLLAKSIPRLLREKPLPQFRYRDYGSLVSLGEYSTVGNLMGKITGSIFVEGMIARLVYLSLYKLHQIALFGVTRVFFLTMSNLFRRAVHPAIKLH